MLKQNEIEEIKTLIKQGFSLKLMSFELDIPMEQLKQYKKELEKEKIRKIQTRPAKDIIKEENKKSSKKIEEMRRKYNNLYWGENIDITKKEKTNELTQEKIEKINIKLEDIEQIVENINANISEEQRLYNMKNIVAQMQPMEQLPIKQSKKMIELLAKIRFIPKDSAIKSRTGRYKKSIIDKIIENIDNCQYETEDVEELKELRRNITSEVRKENYTFATSVEYRINNKISKIEQEKQKNKIKNDIPSEIEQIIKDLANGTLDDKEANQIIESQANKQVQNNKNKFGITKEQKINQILYQIRSNLAQRIDKYNIINPEETTIQMQKIHKGQINPAIRAVVEHLVAKKDFKEAKKLCDKFLENDKDNPNILILQKEIKNAAIGDLVLKGIHMNVSNQEEIAYFKKIEEGIKKARIKPGLVPLGKSKDGLRQITLADIWGDERVRS